RDPVREAPRLGVQRAPSDPAPPGAILLSAQGRNGTFSLPFQGRRGNATEPRERPRRCKTDVSPAQPDPTRFKNLKVLRTRRGKNKIIRTTTLCERSRLRSIASIDEKTI